MTNQQMISPSGQYSSTAFGYYKEFLSKEHHNTGTSPYIPDLAATDFYLFHRPKSSLMGRRICDATTS
jgi:hypothetical protein